MIFTVYVNSQMQLADGQLGSIWDGIIGGAVSSGIQVGVPLLAGLLGGGSSSSSTQAKGLAAITAKGQQVIQGLQTILSQVGQADPNQAISSAQQLAGMLSDSSQFYQAQHGDDAAKLTSLKSQAQSLVQQIETAYAGTAAASTGIVPAPGVVTAVTPAGTTAAPSLGTSSIAGIPLTTLLLILGVGVGAYFLLGK